MAEITLEGWLSKDPEIRFSKSGTAVLGFDIPDNHKRKTQSGEWEDDGTTWYRVSKWASVWQGNPNNGPIEALAEALQKGSRVIVKGDLRMTEREGRDGQVFKNLEINARTVAVIPQAPRNTGQSQQAGGWNQKAPAQASDGWTQAAQPTQGWAQQGGGGWDNGPQSSGVPF